jgi:hypothetical protein
MIMETSWAASTDKGWTIGNGLVNVELVRTKEGGLGLASLARPQGVKGKGAFEWALSGGGAGPAVQTEPGGKALQPEAAGYRCTGGMASELPGGAARLVISFEDSRHAVLELFITSFPGCAALEVEAKLENRGIEPLPLLHGLFPLSLAIGRAGIRVSTSDPKGRHGFYPAATVSAPRVFDNWIVLEDTAAGESLVVGGDLGAGVVSFGIAAEPSGKGLSLRVGANPRSMKDGTSSAIELAPGRSVRTPFAFLAAAAGGPDEAFNAALVYLRRHVMPEPLPGSPLAASCVWLTDPDSEEYLREELAFARRVGFDAFYHDATWVEGSSLVPGMNDWALGVGTYKENPVKFPHGLADLSRRVRDSGMKFGLWIDPGMVDHARVVSGEIPHSWLALRGGAVQQCRHPSLSVMTQVCLGSRDVVQWIKTELAGIIERYGLEWIKWDPSGTVSHACDCPDHGHGVHGGAWAAYEGKMEIWSFLLERFPGLSAFECEPSLRHCRLNPGPRTLMPGAYRCDFMTGPMVGPYVYGSLATIKTTDSTEIPELTAGWCSASTLDYSMRQHLTGGITFGNINGMVSQMLSRAPAGYIESFKRNLLAFKQYRHLLFGNLWHPPLQSDEGWSALQYTAEDASESVLFVFRHPGGGPKNIVRLKGLDPARTYVVTSLNDRPGRDRRLTGASLVQNGLPFELPERWLAEGDGGAGAAYESQLKFGSDLLLLKEAARG